MTISNVWVCLKISYLFSKWNSHFGGSSSYGPTFPAETAPFSFFGVIFNLQSFCNKLLNFHQKKPDIPAGLPRGSSAAPAWLPVIPPTSPPPRVLAPAAPVARPAPAGESSGRPRKIIQNHQRPRNWWMILKSSKIIQNHPKSSIPSIFGLVEYLPSFWWIFSLVG